MGRSSRPLRDLSVRPAAFVAVIALHVPLLFVGIPRQRPAQQSQTITVRLDIEGTPARSAERVPPAASSARSRSDDVTPRNATPDQLSTSEAVPPLPPVDWRISGAIAAQSAVDSIIRDENYQPLGPRKPPQWNDPAPPPPIFEEPKHRYGEVERDALNYDRVWHNEHCYTELGEPVTPRADARIDSVNPPKCMRPLGKKKPRGDLFDHLKRDKAEQPR